MNPKTLKLKIASFQKECNRVRALLSFHKISTLREAQDQLGIPDEIKINERTEVKIGIPEFNSLCKSLEERLREYLQREDHKDKGEEPFWWNEKDFILESYIGKVDRDKELSRKEYLESFVPPRNPLQKANCLYFQYNNALEVFHAITQRKMLGLYIRANTGDGKTYAAGQIIRWMKDSKFLEGKSISPWKILYVTGASIVDQTKEVLEDEFGLDTLEDVHVVNYEALRSSFGEDRFVERKIEVKHNEEHEIIKWRPLLHPAAILWDEGHKLKNERSIQSRLAQACNEINYINPFTGKPAEVYQIFLSATPFSRIVHAKAFAVATKMPYKTKQGGLIKVTNENWKHIAGEIASPADLQEYSRGAIKRFLKVYKDYIFPFKNVRRKFKGILDLEMLEFENEQEQKKYQTAWEEFERRKKQLEGMEYGRSQFLLLVQLLIFRMAAEIIRAFVLARKMYEAHQLGLAPVAACCFKSTISKVVMHLIEDFNVPRSAISIIWGGQKGQEFSREQIMEILNRAMKDPESVSIKTLKAVAQFLGMEAEGLTGLPKEYKLGTQTKEVRNIERKKFQEGKSEYCLFTFGAGKEGISLHQKEDWLRPRRQFNTPTYNEMEMQQAEGRTARITSCSDTQITTLVYKNTIEIPVLNRVMAKRNCLNVVMDHGSKMAEYDKELDKILALVGLERGDEEGEEIEEQVFEQLEDENFREEKENEE